MKLLITGGCGFLGSNIAAEALSRGFDVSIFDNLSRLGSAENLSWLKTKGKFEFKHGDIRSSYDLNRVISKCKPDLLIHLAGQVAMTTSIENPRFDFEINAIGTFNVLEAVRNYSENSTIVYSSTNKVYGDLEQFSYREEDSRYVCNEAPEGFNEHVKLDFHSPYGCSKGAADQYLLDYARIYGLNTIVFRHSSMYGGRQFATYDQGWVGWFCQKAIEASTKGGEIFTISGNGKQVRDLLYATDIVNLYLHPQLLTGALAGQAYNIGGGYKNSSSLLELFGLLENELQVDLQYKKIDPRESDQKIFIADIAKISSKIGWEPRVSKLDGVKKMIEWVKSCNQN